MAGTGNARFNLKYAKNKLGWANELAMAYGLLVQYEKDDRRKTDDKLEYKSELSYKASANWNYTWVTEFKTQFDRGYKSYPVKDGDSYISTFMSPAYLSLSLGMDYKPTKEFSLFMSPFSVKNTIVLDDTLANNGVYKVDPNKKIRSEYGATVIVTYKKKLRENINFMSNLTLFSNLAENPQNVDLNVTFDFDFKITKWLSTKLYAQLKYDDDISVSEEKGPALQLKEVMGLGLSYSF